jgi:hypothetical protein
MPGQGPALAFFPGWFDGVLGAGVGWRLFPEAEAICFRAGCGSVYLAHLFTPRGFTTLSSEITCSSYSDSSEPILSDLFGAFCSVKIVGADYPFQRVQ